MPSNPRFEINLAAELQAAPAREVERESGSFRMAVLGDFSGVGSRGEIHSTPIATRRAWRVDRDDLDAAIAGIRPLLMLRIMPELDPIALTFTSIDDFHPDSLVERVPLFRQLRGLDVPASQTEPKRELPSGIDTRATAASISGAGGGSLLDQIVAEQTPAPAGDATAAAPRPRDDFSQFIEQAVRKHRVAEPTAEQQAIAARTEEVLAAAMRVVLHHPQFQALESLWRAMDLLVRRIDTGESAQIQVFDVSRDELASALAEGAGAPLQQMLTRSSGGDDDGWSLLVVAHAFGPGETGAVASLASLGRRLGAPCIAGALPAFVGVDSLASDPDPDDWTPAQSPEWEALRSSADSAFLALALPRFFVRQPYGARGVACERLAFEEFPTGEREHESLLWGNGALVCALAIGSRVADGDPPPTRATIDGMPFDVATIDGETVATPCADALLGQRAVEDLLDMGLTPLASARDSDEIIIPRIQSVSVPPRPLPIRTP